MDKTVIGIAGVAGSGKDTAADMILEEMPGYVKASFADPLKDMLRVGLGLDNNQLYGSPEHKARVDERYDCSARHIMQTLGTDWGRELIHPDIWVRAMSPRATPGTIIPDVRFENEAAFIRERGVLIHITGRGGITGNHKSESGIQYQDGDLTLFNDGDLEDLRSSIWGILDVINEVDTP